MWETPGPVAGRVGGYPKFDPLVLDGDVSSLCRARSRCPAPSQARNPFAACRHDQPI